MTNCQNPAIYIYIHDCFNVYAQYLLDHVLKSRREGQLEGDKNSGIIKKNVLRLLGEGAVY